MAKWYLLPGMGATSRMYDLIKRKVSFHINYLDWPAYRNERTFRDVAQRIIAEHGIGKSDIVGGSSLGGMVALEMASLLDSKVVVLMGSALGKSEINRLLYALSPLASLAPLSLLHKMSGKFDHIVCQMFSASHPEFIRAMCLYISKWPGYRGSAGKVFRIHGKQDPIIRCPQKDCLVVPNAGHLLTLSHIEICARFLAYINGRFGDSAI